MTTDLKNLFILRTSLLRSIEVLQNKVAGLNMAIDLLEKDDLVGVPSRPLDESL